MNPARILPLLLLAALNAACQKPVEPSSRWALAGNWQLDVTRSPYGSGAKPRRSGSMLCIARGDALECRVIDEYVDGRRVIGQFTAMASGVRAPATGVPGVDAVRLRPVSELVTDATFYFRESPVFGYRAYRSKNGQALTIVAVDPVSRVALTSIVSYERGSPRSSRSTKAKRWWRHRSG